MQLFQSIISPNTGYCEQIQEAICANTVNEDNFRQIIDVQYADVIEKIKTKFESLLEAMCERYISLAMDIEVAHSEQMKLLAQFDAFCKSTKTNIHVLIVEQNKHIQFMLNEYWELSTSSNIVFREVTRIDSFLRQFANDCFTPWIYIIPNIRYLLISNEYRMRSLIVVVKDINRLPIVPIPMFFHSIQTPVIDQSLFAQNWPENQSPLLRRAIEILALLKVQMKIFEDDFLKFIAEVSEDRLQQRRQKLDRQHDIDNSDTAASGAKKSSMKIIRQTNPESEVNSIQSPPKNKKKVSLSGETTVNLITVTEEQVQTIYDRVILPLSRTNPKSNLNTLIKLQRKFYEFIFEIHLVYGSKISSAYSFFDTYGNKIMMADSDLTVDSA